MRILRALDRHLGGHGPVDHGFVRFDAVAVAGPRGALILPPEARQETAWLQRRLRDLGLELADAPYAVVDLETAQIVIGEPGAVDVQELAGRASLRSPAPADPGLAPGRYPLRGWIITSPVDVERSLAAALVHAAGLLRPVPTTLAELDALRRLVDSVPTEVSPSRRGRDILHGVRQLMADGPV